MSLPMRIGLFLVPPLVPALGGCFGIGAFAPDVTRPVPAEYAHLSGDKLAVVVWTDLSTELEDPYLRADIGGHVQKQLRGAVRDVTFASQSDILAMQASDVYWSEQKPADLARRFNADMLMFISVGQFRLNEPGQLAYLQGTLTARCELFDIGRPGQEKVWEKELVAEYPPKNAPPRSESRGGLRSKLLETFAVELTKCFYKHRERVYASTPQ